MTPELEADLMRHMLAGAESDPKARPREWIRAALADGRIKSAKQAWATLVKWDRPDDRTPPGGPPVSVYEYGVTCDLGWLTLYIPGTREKCEAIVAKGEGR
jgi:hypothetical protein